VLEKGGKERIGREEKAGPRTSTQREAGLKRGDPKQREREVPKKRDGRAWLKKYGDGVRLRAREAEDEARMKVRDEDKMMAYH
jgi:hypothetical protein